MGKLVLVVDDDPDLQEIMSAMLRKEGYEVEVARNGEEGVRMALDLRPAIVLMDAGLPVVDGWRATARIKASAPQLRVIMLTAHVLPDHVTLAQAVGCDGFLRKPIDPHDVVRAVRDSIGPSESAAPPP